MARRFYFLDGYNNTYKISKDGLLKNKDGSSKYLYKEKSGYLTTPLMLNSIQKTHSVHRLVATQFIPNPEKKTQVNHKNGIKIDNRVENLEWCTRKENSQHAFRIGLMKRMTGGESHISAKLSKESVIDIFTSGKSMKELISEHKTNRHNIYQIQSGNSWKSVTDGLTRRLSRISQERRDKNKKR